MGELRANCGLGERSAGAGGRENAASRVQLGVGRGKAERIFANLVTCGDKSLAHDFNMTEYCKQ